MGKFWDLVKAQKELNEHKKEIKRYEDNWDKIRKNVKKYEEKYDKKAANK